MAKVALLNVMRLDGIARGFDARLAGDGVIERDPRMIV